MLMRKPYANHRDFIYKRTEILIKLTVEYFNSILKALKSMYLVGYFGQRFCLFGSLFTVERIVL